MTEPTAIELTREQIIEQVDRLKTAVKSQLDAALERIWPTRARNGWVVALFDCSDERAMRVAERLGKDTHRPKDVATIAAMTLERVTQEARKDGYKVDQIAKAPEPGTMRILLFTLGVVIVEVVDVKVMSPGGAA